jgi:predicted SAM-dependent methyltransferase
MKLHVGATKRTEGWTTLDILPGPEVDIVADISAMTEVSSGTCELVYVSHVLEHLSYQDALPRALRECYRVLQPGGKLMISVPDFGWVCKAWNRDLPYERRWWLMRMVMGGQCDGADFHHTIFWWDMLRRQLEDARFTNIQRVQRLHVFNDSSEGTAGGELFSINATAERGTSGAK